jgi:hypothetical protein
MSKKIEKMYVVGGISCDTQIYHSIKELEDAFDNREFDEDEEILEVQVVKRFLASTKLDMIET